MKRINADKFLYGLGVFIALFGIVWLSIAFSKIVTESKKEPSTRTEIVIEDGHKYILFFSNNKCVYVEHSPSCECMSLGIDYD